jgi:gluconolactonase
MNNRQRTMSFSILLALILSLAFLNAEGQSIQDPPFGRPDAVVDVASREGVPVVNGQWRYHDVRIVDADSRTVDLT